MDYEQKYKKALEWARKVMQGKVGFVLDEVLEKFPELKESDDDKISKKIIATIHLYYGEPLEDEAKEMIAWLEKQGEQKPAWSEEDEKIIRDIHCFLNYRTTCQLHDQETKERVKKIVSWLDELKNRVLPQQKEWSEENKKNLNQAIYVCHQHGYTGVEKWLKSIRPQQQWKPSDEQMEALKEAVDEHFDIDGGALWHLYEDLKKLME